MPFENTVYDRTIDEILRIEGLFEWKMENGKWRMLGPVERSVGVPEKDA